MKKYLFGLMAILSLTSFAKTHFYVGAGVNYNADTTFVKAYKKIKTKQLSATKDFSDSNKLTQYILTKTLIETVKEDKARFYKNLHLKLEVTTDVSDNLELGAGIKYFADTQPQVNIEAKEFIKKAEKIKEELGNKVNNGNKANIENMLKIKDAIKEGKYTVDLPSHNSIPLYLTAKYNFRNVSDTFTPYVKADFGYAINLEPKEMKDTFNYKLSQETRENKETMKEFEDAAKTSNGADKAFSVSHSFYTAVAVGTEYKNFFGELGLAFIGGKTTQTLNGVKLLTIPNPEIKTTFTVGYKF